MNGKPESNLVPRNNNQNVNLENSKKLPRNTKIKIFLFGLVIIVPIYPAFQLSEDDLKQLLIVLAQINVAIAVGIGAISIPYARDSLIRNKLTEVTITIGVLSILTLLIAYVGDYSLIREIYLCGNVALIVLLLISTLVTTYKFS